MSPGPSFALIYVKRIDHSHFQNQLLRRGDVVLLRLLRVEGLDGEGATGHREERRVVEVALETRGVERGAHHHHLQVLALRQDVLQNAHQDVRRQRALVSLIQHDDGVASQQRVSDHLAQQQSIGHELESRALRRHVLESDGVAHLLAELHVHLLRHALRNGVCRHSTRLRAADDPLRGGMECNVVKKQCLHESSGE